MNRSLRTDRTDTRTQARTKQPHAQTQTRTHTQTRAHRAVANTDTRGRTQAHRQQTVLTGPQMQEMFRFGPQVNRKLVSSPSDSGWQETKLSVHMSSRPKEESDAQLEIASQTKK